MNNHSSAICRLGLFGICVWKTSINSEALTTTGKDHDASSVGLRASFKSPKCPVSARRQVVKSWQRCGVMRMVALHKSSSALCKIHGD
jgi:hypothetical protein